MTTQAARRLAQFLDHVAVLGVDAGQPAGLGDCAQGAEQVAVRDERDALA